MRTHSTIETHHNWRPIQQMKIRVRVTLTSTEVLVTMLDIEVNFVCDSWTLGCFYGLRTEEGSYGDSSETDQYTTEIHGELGGEEQLENQVDVAATTLIDWIGHVVKSSQIGLGLAIIGELYVCVGSFV